MEQAQIENSNVNKNSNSSENSNFVENRKYAAFISYRHLSPDKEIAQALHRMLEHNQVRPNRNVPRNIRPVFLDTGELPTQESLEDSILHALDHSECLFVICSPNLPKSKYCMREVEYFKNIHGGRLTRVYTVLADGDPSEAFPEILRTETRTVTDENGVEQGEMTVEVEPLFADVRAETIPESIKKLRKTEYLRLAAAYFDCSYDDLYKRRRRWIWKVASLFASILLLASLLFGIYVWQRNLQYDTAKATTYASYAEKCIDEQDELLAITLCREGAGAAKNSRVERLVTAMRSAFVQYEYKTRGLPFSPVLHIDYEKDPLGNNYLFINEDKSKILTVSNNLLQISDLINGAVYQKINADRIQVEESPNRVFMIHVTKDEEGEFWDTVSVLSLVDYTYINSFNFRKASRDKPDYKLYSVHDSDIYILKDHNVEVAYLTSEGEQISEEEAMSMAGEPAGESVSDQAGDQTREPDKEPATESVKGSDAEPGIDKESGNFHVTGGNRFKGTGSSVVDADGNQVLPLGETTPLHDFSGDGKYFCYAADKKLLIYDTDQWNQVGELELEEDLLQAVHLLDDSRLVLCVYKYGEEKAVNGFYDILSDWTSGKETARMEGWPEVVADNMFICSDQGTVTRYTYHDMDTDAREEVVKRYKEKCMTLSDRRLRILDTDKKKNILEIEFTDKETNSNEGDFKNSSDEKDKRIEEIIVPSFDRAIKTDKELDKVLIRDDKGITCYDDGKLLWSVEDGIDKSKAESDAAYTAESTDTAKATDTAKSAATANDRMALSEDGTVAAWLDSMNVIYVADASDGRKLYEISEKELKKAGTVHSIAVNKNGLCAAGSDGAVWYPIPAAEGAAPIDRSPKTSISKDQSLKNKSSGGGDGKPAHLKGELLDDYGDWKAALFEDNILVLESDDAYVMDFEVWDMKEKRILLIPEKNTGRWLYSPQSHYLVRQVETNGNGATSSIEFSRLEAGEFRQVSTFNVSENAIQDLMLDSTGQYLTILVGNTSEIIRLQDEKKVIHVTNGKLCYEDGRFWGQDVYGYDAFSLVDPKDDELYRMAEEVITSPSGTRTLSEEERGKYSFTQ